MPDSFRHVGRGGAGNYTAQAPPTGSEPQPTEVASTPTPASGDSPVSHPQPIRSGRGGAGNFLPASEAASAADQAKLTERTEAAVKERLKAGQQFMVGGRGGAGNWNQDGQADQVTKQEAEEEEEADKRVQLDRQAQEVVDLGLRPPEKIHERRVKSWLNEPSGVGGF